MQIFSWEDVSVYNLSHIFLCLGSTDMFPRSVPTTRRVHARVHTLKDRCLLTFWVTKSFLCVTLNIWHHVGHQIFHRQVETTLHNFLTYMDVFAWKGSHRSTCVHTTCHTISYDVPNRHVSTQCVYYKTCSCACSHTKRRVCAHFLDLWSHVYA